MTPEVDRAIISTLLPQLYRAINDLLDHSTAPKEVILRARKLLPAQYANSIVRSKTTPRPQEPSLASDEP